jgi:molybdenum cofactor cytidylyltransferase
MIGTTKILPYALPAEMLESVERDGSANGPLLWLEPLPERRVGLIVTGAPSSRDQIVAGFESALRQRVEALGSRLDRIDFVPLQGETGDALERLAALLREQRCAGLDLVLLAGETAIQDRHDLAPSAVEAAGGVVDCFGAPVDPGNLLMLGHLGDVPVMGAPGCARSPKANIVDLLLPRLLAGERLTQTDIVALGHGGLLEDVPERPLPRSRI